MNAPNDCKTCDEYAASNAKLRRERDAAQRKLITLQNSLKHDLNEIRLSLDTEGGKHEPNIGMARRRSERMLRQLVRQESGA